MSSRYTRTGVRRSGDDYQDIVALDLIIEMLEHPTRYQWIRVEADEVGFLDDVVALRADGSFVVKQVKFSAHPEQDDDAWSWERLLEQKEDKKKKKLPSLLEKWVTSLEKLSEQQPVYEASLISNRRVNTQIRSVLSPDGIVNFVQVDNSIRESIIQQIGDETKARNFFSNFHFYSDRSSLEIFEESLRIRFYRLGGDDKGWLNLKDELRSWVRNRNQPSPDGAITLPVVRNAALWYQLQSLPQNFEIPQDYVLPSVDFHNSLTQNILSLQQGCVVVSASPGVGKSTYLSYLFEYLSAEEIPVIRHHYFLSLSDRTVGRLDHTRIAESLMSDIQRNFPDTLGEREKKNPHFRELGEWINACGQYFLAQEKNFVIIIDGLDHVWRDQQSVEELDKLFEYLLPTPQGVVIVIGTQPVDNAQLPSRLSGAAPREQWYKLPFLDLNAVENWIQKHAHELDLPEVENSYNYFAETLAKAFFNRSQGHPLHLRYTLKALQEQNLPVTVENIESLPGCPHQDITIYYEELWNRLPSEAHTILRLFAVCNFPWPPKEIVQCCSPQALNLVQINDALRQTKHLLVQDSLGLRPFHSSLLVFIAGQYDYEMYSPIMKQLALNWLRTKAPEYWKWAYEWLLEAELDNEQLLIDGPSRQWLIEALVKGYPYEQVEEILDRSAWLSLQQRNLTRYVEVALLRDYFSYATTLNRLDILDSLLYPQLFVEDDSFLRSRLHTSIINLTETKLVLLAENESKRKNQFVVHQCFNELNARLFSNRISKNDDLRTILKLTSTVAALDEEITPQKIVEFSVKNIENVGIEFTLQPYIKALKTWGIMPSLRQVLRMDIPIRDKSFIYKDVILLALDQNINLNQDTFININEQNPFIVIYAFIHHSENFEFLDIEFPSPRQKIENFEFRDVELPSADLLSIHETEQFQYRYIIGDLFYKIFFIFLANYLLQRGQKNKSWLMNLGNYSWPRNFIHKLNSIADKLAKVLTSESAFSYNWFYEQVSDIKKPTWPEEREIHGYGVSAAQALTRISLDVIILLKALRKNFKITKDEFEAALSSDYCHPWDFWLDEYLERKQQWLTQEAVQWFLQYQIDYLANLIEPFNERATKYAKLASLATLHDLVNEAKFFIQETASNLISFGEHKDMLLWHILNNVQACNRAKIPEAKQWLLQLAPLIAEVENFTDGDETGGLPRELANVLVDVAPDLLPIYYQWLCSKEEYYDALSVFHTFLINADLSSKINQAIAKTALDEESLLILESRAESGEQEAELVLRSILNFMGNNALTKAKSKNSQLASSSSQSGLESKPLPSPDNFPPDKLKDYLAAVRQADSYVRSSINPWVKFWTDTEQAENALSAIEQEVNSGYEFKDYDEIFYLALAMYGKDYAYPWLIKAHLKHYGWRNYYGKEDSICRWKIVKNIYPDRWFDFILDTLKSSSGNPWRDVSVYNSLDRLVDYCILMEQTDLAKQITERAIASTLELVSPLKLPIPEWINQA